MFLEEDLNKSFLKNEFDPLKYSIDSKKFSFPAAMEDTSSLPRLLGDLRPYSLSFQGSLCIHHGIQSPIPLIHKLFLLIVKDLTNKVIIHKTLFANLLAAITLTVQAFFEGSSLAERISYFRDRLYLPVNFRYIDYEECFPHNQGPVNQRTVQEGVTGCEVFIPKKTPYHWSFLLEVLPYDYKDFYLARSRGYCFLTNYTPALNDNLWDFLRNRSSNFELRDELALIRCDLKITFKKTENDIARSICSALKLK